ncbi:hypothetical protein [Bacillus sp. CECT 9360]|uniref:hypothetical protein n=1 Tax=Bacillus sp. CECT 9360 TaxID=2845821 RepID=UPI001E4D57F3|nr:hypothetical protein [Bacillus sp. CECT 9360]CAH0344131.1 hypothetical protein BCI9360_00362 [Bacillus sp. CECT 9360]
MKATKLKKFTAGIAMATLIGSSVPTLAGAHWDSPKDEGKHHSEHKSRKHDYSDNQRYNHWNNKNSFINRLEQGDKLGSLTVESVEKGDDSTTVSFSGELNVKGSYDPESGQFSFKRYGQKHFGKTILVNNQADVNQLLQGQDQFSKLTGTLSNIQLVASSNDFTVKADLKNLQPANQ